MNRRRNILREMAQEDMAWRWDGPPPPRRELEQWLVQDAKRWCRDRVLSAPPMMTDGRSKSDTKRS